MEARRITFVWFLISFLLLNGVQTTSAEKCKFEEKFVCGNEDCNCQYVGPSFFSLSNLYKRFSSLISRLDDDGKVCDKCDVFCSKEKHINCYEGACDKEKGCICRNCWSGETCSKYENQNNPVFQQQTYIAEIKEKTSVGEQILQVFAFDSDLEMCVDKDNCPCGKIKYSIIMGNEQQYFFIDPETGVLSLVKELLDSNHASPFILHIKAENEDVENTDENKNPQNVAVVTLSVANERQNVVRRRRSTHHRARRDVQTYDSLITTFAPDTSMATFFAAGCDINFRLFVAQNASKTPIHLSSIIVTLTSTNLDIDSSSLVLNISDSIIVSNPTMTEFSLTLNISENLDLNDYMELKFVATVRNTAQPLSVLQVAFSMNATGNTTQYQYGPTYSTTIYAAYPQITFASNYGEAVNVETNLDYNVNVTLPYFNFSLIFEISTTVNQIRFLSIENVATDSISSSVSPQTTNPSPVKYTGVEDNITSRAVLDFGQVEVLNKNQSLNTMKLSFSIRVNDHFLLENNSRHWVGVGVRSGEEMLWVGQERVTIFKDEPFLVAEITTLNNTAPTRYYMNDELHFSWNVAHANISYATAKNVKISILVPSSLVLNDKSIDVAATPTQISDSGKSGYRYTLSSTSFLQSSTASGSVRVTVKNDNNVTPFTDLNMEIKLYYQTPEGIDRPVKTYRPNPGYFVGAPTFNLTSNYSGRSVQIGKVVEISLDVVVQKISLPGIIEVILPVKNKSAIMRYIRGSFAIVSVGSNLEGTQLTNPDVTLNSSVNHTKYFDRAIYNIGEVHNKDLRLSSFNDLQTNTITIKFQVLLEDHMYISNATKYWVGVGLKAGLNMVWIGQLAVTADVPLVRRPRVLISTSSNGTKMMKQGDIVQYNFTISHQENSNGHAREVEILWMMPAYTKLAGVSVNSHNMQLTKTRNNLLFKLPILDFLETPSVSFSIFLDPFKTLKHGKSFAVTPVALTYKDNTETFYEPLVPMSVSFNVPSPPPSTKNAVAEFYYRGFLVENSSSAVYLCKVSAKRNKPSCFWTNTKGSVWRAVDFLVVNIIGIDSANKIVYGIGNNKKAYMKYLPDEGKWYSISRDHWENVKPTLSNQIIIIENEYNHEGDPEEIKEHKFGNGEKWGANNIGIYYYTPNMGWDRKALWDCCLN